MISTQPLLPFPRTVAAGPEPGSDGPVGFVTGLVERLGGPGAGLAVALENLFPPIPSEVILPLAGFVASQGRMSLVGAIGWTTLGSVVGALALYWIGAMLGRDRMRAIAAKLPLVKLEDVDRTEAWFLRHGVKAVFFGRMIPVFRSLISIPAGVERMPVLTFLLYTTLGSLIWNTVFVLAGYLLGENWHVVEAYVGTFQNVVIAVSALAVAWFVVTRVRRSRAARRDAAASASTSASTSVSPSANSSVGGPSVGGPSAEEHGGDLVGFARGPAGYAGGPAGHGPSAGADRGLPTGPERGTGEYRGTVYRSGSWRGGPEH